MLKKGFQTLNLFVAAVASSTRAISMLTMIRIRLMDAILTATVYHLKLTTIEL